MVMKLGIWNSCCKKSALSALVNYIQWCLNSGKENAVTFVNLDSLFQPLIGKE